jgi:hypothetical protein
MLALRALFMGSYVQIRECVKKPRFSVLGAKTGISSDDAKRSGSKCVLKQPFKTGV